MNCVQCNGSTTVITMLETLHFHLINKSWGCLENSHFKTINNKRLAFVRDVLTVGEHPQADGIRGFAGQIQAKELF